MECHNDSVRIRWVVSKFEWCSVASRASPWPMPTKVNVTTRSSWRLCAKAELKSSEN